MGTLKIGQVMAEKGALGAGKMPSASLRPVLPQSGAEKKRIK